MEDANEYLVDENGNFIEPADSNEILDPSFVQSLVRGKKHKPINALELREITEEDILDLETREDCPTRQQANLTRIRHSHHMLARLIAMGVSYTDAGRDTGYSISRISTLMKDPAFSQLVDHYAEEVRDVTADVQERMKSLALDAVAVAQERLDECPEEVSMKELTDLIKTAADRGGHAPTSNLNINTSNIDVSVIAQMKLEAQEAQQGHVRTISQTISESDKRIEESDQD